MSFLRADAVCCPLEAFSTTQSHSHLVKYRCLVSGARKSKYVMLCYDTSCVSFGHSACQFTLITCVVSACSLFQNEFKTQAHILSLVSNRKSRQPDVQSILWLQRRRQSTHLLDEGGEVHWGSGRGASPGKRHQVRLSTSHSSWFWVSVLSVNSNQNSSHKSYLISRVLI